MIPFFKTHVLYVVLIAIGLLAFHSWLAEHDARLVADKQAALAEQSVKQLADQIKDIQVATATKVQAVKTVVAAARTPTQQVAAIPQLTDIPLNARAVPDITRVEVDLPALVQELGSCRQAQITADSCSQASALKDQQLVQKDTEIAALKKKPSFWKRVGSTAKQIGIGIGIGLTLGKL